jgi:glycosyltransferase involved in cell wall biosynthesis
MAMEQSGRSRRRVLIFVDHYLPGSNFGGPVRTIANLTSRLSNEYDFFIFTADRDFRSTEPYADVTRDQWLHRENASIHYTADRSLKNILRRVEEVKPDLIYLNSFFSRVTVKILWARPTGRFAGIPVLLAPRGEFAGGALAIKPLRKKLYIWLVNTFSLLRNVTLHASTEFEKDEIEGRLTKSLRMARAAPLVASDIPGTATKTVMERLKRIPKERGLIRVLFLARASRNKNLDGALRIAREVKGEVLFTICGPVGDEAYWQECLAIIKGMPQNVTVNVMGAIEHEKIPEVISNHGLLLLPTHGENFGHSIIEALLAGCPVLITDRTPWRNLEEAGVGADLPLEQPERFVEFMQSVTDMDNETFSRWSIRAREYGLKCIESPELLAQNRRMLDEAMRSETNSRE